MKLNRHNLYHKVEGSSLIKPENEVFAFPEKVLQFGTGVLLRGLPDYFISQANDLGIFRGRIVVVKSTSQGDTSAFDEQDNLYLTAVRGIREGQEFEQYRICAAISRVLTAQEEWAEILQVAASPELEIVISNTTEQGLVYQAEFVSGVCPESFPGKLLAVLHHRYTSLRAECKGLVILPTELLTDNGSLLKQILNQLANFNCFEPAFIRWLNEKNDFCNTLVDRIVPGKPDTATQSLLEEKTGFEDELLICAEPYAFWAIEGPERLKDILSFYAVDPGIIITENIDVYKELKLRLLNGSHTLSCAVAILSGFSTVKAAMQDSQFNEFVNSLIEEELSYGIPLEIDRNAILDFGRSVMDRFRNPTIDHLWTSISSNYTLKMESRVVPAITTYYRKFNTVPKHIAFGFAAYLLLEEGSSAEADNTIDVEKILSEKQMWNQDLNQLSGFSSAVQAYLDILRNKGAKFALADFLQNPEIINETK